MKQFKVQLTLVGMALLLPLAAQVQVFTKLQPTWVSMLSVLTPTKTTCTQV